MNQYDVIIIGGGPGGLSAAIYAGRSRLKTMIIEKSPVLGGQVLTTECIDNYPGFAAQCQSFALTNTMEQQIKTLHVEIKTAEVLSIEQNADKTFQVNCADANYQAKSLILATGAHPRKLGVVGEKELTGRGVSYCATCDGPFFNNAEVFVIGGGDSAVEEASYLTRFAKKVWLVHRRDKLRAAPILQDRVFNNPKIEILWDSVLQEIRGENKVEQVVIKNVKSGEEAVYPAEGVFIYVGILPNTQFVKDFVHLDDAGFILTERTMETNRPGVFAAGDVRDTPLRQIITAASDGAIAAFFANKYIETVFD